MWTERSPGSSNEEGKKGRHRKGQFADLVGAGQGLLLLRRGRDLLHRLGADHGRRQDRLCAGDFKTLDENDIPPAMPDWSPVRKFGGYAGWGEPQKSGCPLTSAHRDLHMRSGK